MKQSEKLQALHDRLLVIGTVKVAQIDTETNSVGLTFEYLGDTFTTYISAETERGDLLKHDHDDLTTIENMGELSADQLIGFFGSLPGIESILR